MNAHVLHGSKQEIAKRIAQIPGEVREAIVFLEESADASLQSAEDIFAEMEPFTANVGGADYSREAIYSRVEGE